ncbi:MAG: L,D-transpeptidase [Candidatus Sulfotelmatobacter sp.]|jgi:lipoprotein-anchoring transpeptidase ErfK/SrfK
MKFKLTNLSGFVAVAAILFGTSIATAAKHPAPSVRPVGLAELEMQVLLDRANFSPGQIDDENGKNSREAMAAFEAARGIAPGARSRNAALAALGAGSVKSIASYTITAEDAAGPFIKTIPEDATDQSKLPGLYYTSVLEELSARFHSAPSLLKRLNLRARFVAGESIRVPNVLGAKPAELGPAGAVKIVVSKKTSVLMVYNREGRVIFYAPVTSGSEHDPLPFGNWVITDVVRNPIYNYNPDLFWDANPANAKVKIAAGPNNPVGVVWMGINVPHYGIHGTPDAEEIGHSQSHGCVRLTNWDAIRVADLVKDGTPVVFEE